MPKRFWEIKNSSEDENIGEMLMYGSLANTTWWDDEVTPKQFNKDLDDLGAKDELHIRINSYGGDVFAGHAIFNAIKNYKRKHNATIKVFIDGIAASAASVVAMAGDKIIIPSNAMMMVHDPMIGLCRYVNETQLQKFINELKKIKLSIIAAYHDRTGNDKEAIATTMKEETWMTAEEAIEMGYADVMSDDIELDVQMTADNHMKINDLDIDCKHFNKMPSQFMNMVKKPKVTNSLKDDPKEPEVKQTEPTNKTEEDIVNETDLKNKHPELHETMIQNAAKEERKRIEGIKNLAMPGQEALVNKALFETPMNVGEFAIAQTNAQKKIQATTLEDIKADAGKLDDVEAPDDKTSTKEEEFKNDVSDMTDMINE